ncbi:MAG: tetratricopeptide repeat protein [Planctomycetes bacterium]|nr:tetratricopeptide repeat protein [Planctomycetota bacterium]
MDDALRKEADGLFDDVIKEWHELRPDASDLEDRIQLARNLNNRGNHFRKWGQFEKAQKDHELGLGIVEAERKRATGEEQNLVDQVTAQHHWGIGMCHMEQKKFEEARGEFSKALALRRELFTRHRGAPLVCVDFASTYHALAMLEFRDRKPAQSLVAVDAGWAVLEEWPNTTKQVLGTKIKLLRVKHDAFVEMGQTVKATATNEQLKRLEILQGRSDPFRPVPEPKKP